MKVYVTRYALTQGIFEVEGEPTKSSPSMFRQATKPGYSWNYYHKPFWHETKEEAIKHAEQLKDKKIVSLKKQITKLEKLKF